MDIVGRVLLFRPAMQFNSEGEKSNGNSSKR